MKGKVRMCEPNEITKDECRNPAKQERLVPGCLPIWANQQVSKKENTLLILLGSGLYQMRLMPGLEGYRAFRRLKNGVKLLGFFL